MTALWFVAIATIALGTVVAFRPLAAARSEARRATRGLRHLRTEVAEGGREMARGSAAVEARLQSAETTLSRIRR